jgi:hypothetical protein
MNKHYSILEHDTREKLEAHVFGMMKLGWTPQGGVAVSSHYETGENSGGNFGDSVYTYAQAMVKDTPLENSPAQEATA